MQHNTIHHKPESPKIIYRHERNRRIGELLRAGHSFRDAMRMVDREFDRYQHAQRTVERSLTHPFSGSNPAAGRNWLVLGGVALGLYWLSQRVAGASTSNGQLPTPPPNPPLYGSASSTGVAVTATPGGY